MDFFEAMSLINGGKDHVEAWHFIYLLVFLSGLCMLWTGCLMTAFRNSSWFPQGKTSLLLILPALIGLLLMMLPITLYTWVTLIFLLNLTQAPLSAIVISTLVFPAYMIMAWIVGLRPHFNAAPTT